MPEAAQCRGMRRPHQVRRGRPGTGKFWRPGGATGQRRNNGEMTGDQTTARTIANLLRLAEADLRDAAVLAKREGMRNAGLLQHSAACRIIDAVLASEPERDGSEPGSGNRRIPQANPMRLRLQALEARARPPAALLPNGLLSAPPEADELASCQAEARALLREIGNHFAVDFRGEDPAGSAAPMRPAPPPPPPKAATLARRATNPAARPARRGGEAAPPPDPASGGIAHPPKPLSSTVFWSLVDRWSVTDLDALRLLGHAGGLTKNGTRPRFRLAGAEAEMAMLLRTIDEALTTMGIVPRSWIAKPIAEAPFRGATPLALLMRRHIPAARDIGQYILQLGLRQSLRQS
jgi:hypothetical protein